MDSDFRFRLGIDAADSKSPKMLERKVLPFKIGYNNVAFLRKLTKGIQIWILF